MKFTLTVVALVAILALAESQKKSIKENAFVKTLKKLHRGPPVVEVKGRSTVETKWITQKLDHFDEANDKTWEMRYMVNEEHFENGGPMFIHLGGEWDITPGSIQYGLFPDLAEEHKGILFYTEHRYYGESKPTKNILVENLQYLDVKQALADVAHFIRTQRATDPRLANSKVILSGGSYSATMVVWFAKLYPELVNGGWASSAPLLAKVDFFEYFEVVGKSILQLGSQQCYNRIQKGIAELEEMFKGNRSAEAKAMLQLCNSFDHHNDLDLWTLFSSISNIFAAMAQYQSGNEMAFYCNYLMSFEDDLTAISKLFLLVAADDSGCVDTTYKSTLAYYLDSTYAAGAARPWYYQTCNEYGWYQSSASPNQPFGTKFPAFLYINLCYDIFGSKYTNENIHKFASDTNEFFGGMFPEVKNVYMTHGALDPWSAMGQDESLGATVIPQASHCADFGSISPTESKEMRESKERLVELVREWLA